MGVAIRITTTDAPAQPGHARGSSDGQREQQPRVPIIGVDSGCIPGTRPGCSARELERAGRDIVHAALARKRLNHAAKVGRMEPSSRPR